MELQFQRSEPKEDEFASVVLKPGDYIDDSMAMFDAINFSGGIKRALMSLSVGMHVNPQCFYLFSGIFSSLLLSTINVNLCHTQKVLVLILRFCSITF